jgi:hypothetical protein
VTAGWETLLALAVGVATAAFLSSFHEVWDTHPERYRERLSRMLARRPTWGAIGSLQALVAWFVVLWNLGFFGPQGAGWTWWVVATGIAAAAGGYWMGWRRAWWRIAQSR